MTGGYALAIDAGNTKTTVVVSDLNGAIVGRADTGPGDIYGTDGPEAAVASVVQAIGRALTAADVRARDIAAAMCCLAGVDWPEDAGLWEKALGGVLPEARLGVLNDGFALLWCLNPAGTGVAINVGTGPAIAARAPSGRTAFMGFWCQHPLGGVGLGERALQAIYLAELGLAAPTSLRDALLAEFRFDDVESLLHHCTKRYTPVTRSTVASAAPAVLGCASHGDPVALALVADQARLLAEYAAAIAGRAGLDPSCARIGGQPWPVAIGGGVAISILPIFKDALVAQINERLPRSTPTVISTEPVMGSVVGAMGLLEPGLARAGFSRLMGSTATVLGQS